ncbi:MAG: DUF1295 domain-containing protein [Cyclobacteriaceae bacterium]|nr:DUF1295 domain-containing protein [Cyclobacteriaceae bacterium]
MIKLNRPINWHKGLTAPVVVALMAWYNNFEVAPLLYLALHGSYGVLWLLKDRWYPDRQWDEQVSLGYAVFVWFALAFYWIAPWLLIAQKQLPPPWAMATAVALNMIGTMLHFGSDAQKYFTLKYHPGLITSGFFARCRNINYLGELMIYSGFALLAWHWAAWIGIGLFFALAFVPNMIRKDRSLSRYPEFSEYRRRSGWLLPRLF